MPDRENDMDRNLEQELRDLGAHIEHPPTPDIARTVRRRLEEEEASRRRGFWSRMPSARWAVAAAILLILVVPMFSPAFRGAVSSVFVSSGAGGASSQSASPAGEAGSDAPASSSEDSPDSASSAGSATSGAAGTGSSGGEVAEVITLEEARSRTEGLLLLPELGEPDEVYALGRGGVMLVYPSGDSRIVLTQRPGEVETAFPAASRMAVEDAAVNGGRGYWRSSGTLFWERDGMALRLRTDLSKEGAIQLAESARWF